MEVTLEVVVTHVAIETHRVALQAVVGCSVLAKPVATLDAPTEELETVLVFLCRPEPWEIVVRCDRPVVADAVLLLEEVFVIDTYLYIKRSIFLNAPLFLSIST